MLDDVCWVLCGCVLLAVCPAGGCVCSATVVRAVGSLGGGVLLIVCVGRWIKQQVLIKQRQQIDQMAIMDRSRKRGIGAESGARCLVLLAKIR
jgi:hypothetical protein